MKLRVEQRWQAQVSWGRAVCRANGAELGALSTECTEKDGRCGWRTATEGERRAPTRDQVAESDTRSANKGKEAEQQQRGVGCGELGQGHRGP